MLEKIFSTVARLSLNFGCSMATPGSRASAALKDKDGKVVATAMLSERPGGVLVRVEAKQAVEKLVRSPSTELRTNGEF